MARYRSHRAIRPFLVVVAVALTGCGGDGPTDPPPVGEIVVSAISPELLRPGEEAVLDGHNFASSSSGNEVRVHGERVQVIEASSTRLRIRLPDFLCAPEGEVPVVVEVDGEESEPFLRAFEPVGVIELAPGEFHRAAAPGDLCVILGEGSGAAEYVVGTQSTSETTELLTGVSVLGRVPGVPSGSGGLLAGSPASATSGARAGRPGGGAAPRLASLRGADDRWAQHERAEAHLRFDERGLADRLLRPNPASGLAASSFQPRVPSNVQPGDEVSLRVPDVSEDANSCTDGTEIDAVVRRVGQRSIWVEDVDNPSGGFTDEDYELLAGELDFEIFEEVSSYFGEPTDLDDNGRIVIVVSEQVNRTTGALAYVVLSDFFPNECAGANGGEYYYARAPDPQGDVPGPDGAAGSTYSRSDALEDAPRLLAHEITHIVQFGRRLQLTNPDGIFQAIWILEGQATFAEEVVGHRYTGAQPRQNLGRSIALASNHPPTNLGWYQTPFFDLAVYYGFDVDEGAPEECSWLDVREPDPCISGRIAYGVTWSFLRWLADHFHDRFPGGEREFQRRLVDSPAWGFATFEDVLGEDPAELLAPWAAMLYVDDRGSGNPDPLLRFPSWNLVNIEQGLVDEAHLRPHRVSFANFRREAQVAAASSYYQRLTTSSGHPPFALAARTATGGVLPDFMQLWIARLR